VQADCWLSGSADTQVRRYVKGKPELSGSAYKIGKPVECVAIDPKGKNVAIASCVTRLQVIFISIHTFVSRESSVRIFELEDKNKVRLLEGHTKGVRRVTWHPSGSLLVRPVHRIFAVSHKFTTRQRAVPRATSSSGMFQRKNPKSCRPSKASSPLWTIKRKRSISCVIHGI
jgi:WD40 repeat protein